MNTSSTHAVSCFKAVTSGVYHRLSFLTTVTSGNANVPLAKLYPEHVYALKVAGYDTCKTPLLKHAYHDRKANKSNKMKIEPNTKFLVLKYSKYWDRLNVQSTIDRLLKLTQLDSEVKVKCVFSVFPNINRLFKKDIFRKTVRETTTTIQGGTRECNCRGECIVGGSCRMTTVVYSIRMKPTGSFYIGSTSSVLKGRILNHITNIRKACAYYMQYGTLNTVPSVGRARFIRYSLLDYVILKVLVPLVWKNGPVRIPSPRELHDLFHYSIIWKGNALEVGPTYGTTRCALCAKEEQTIRAFKRVCPGRIVNDIEMIQGCPHKVLSGSPKLVTESGAEEA